MSRKTKVQLELEAKLKSLEAHLNLLGNFFAISILLVIVAGAIGYNLLPDEGNLLHADGYTIEGVNEDIQILKYKVLKIEEFENQRTENVEACKTIAGLSKSTYYRVDYDGNLEAHCHVGTFYSETKIYELDVAKQLQDLKDSGGSDE